MGSGGNKKTVQPDDNKTVAAIDAVNVKNPLQQSVDAKAQKFFDWDNSTGPKDVTEAPGFGDLVDIYGNAEAAQGQRRVGNPQAAFGSTANPNFSHQLEQQGAMDRYNVRASGLNQGLQGLKAQAYGLADQSINNDMQRRQTYASLLGQNSRDYYNRPQKPSLWQQIAGVAIGGLQAAAPFL